MEPTEPTWRDVFSNTAAMLAFFGLLGGTVRAVVLRLNWRETLRVMFVGAAMAFGVGALSPHLLRFVIGDLPKGAESALGTLCAAAFLVGLVAVALVERLIAKTEGRDHEA